ncbi:MAG: cupin domain-containing protein [Aridibacter famidurans]|nr:cupin domain-containing protein [Aridibacter famidurans]
MNIEHLVWRWQEVYDPNPAHMRYLFEQAGFSVFQWADQPGAFYGNHKHAEAQSHWIISGSLEIQIETLESVILEPGDRDLVPANAYHTARVIGEEPVIYLVGEQRRRF